MAIRWGKGQWRYPGMRVELIFNSPIMLTCSIGAGREIDAACGQLRGRAPSRPGGSGRHGSR
mgnify:CR=1 FL=1